MARRRLRLEGLKPVDGPSWLTITDRLGKVIETTELAPRVEPRDVLNAMREKLAAAGWMMEEESFSHAFPGFFCRNGDMRVLVLFGSDASRPSQNLGHPETTMPWPHASEDRRE